MKKIILSVAAVFAFGFANAQNLTSSKGITYHKREIGQSDSVLIVL